MDIAGMRFNARASVLVRPFSEQVLIWQITDIQVTDLRYLKILFAVFYNWSTTFSLFDDKCNKIDFESNHERFRTNVVRLIQSCKTLSQGNKIQNKQLFTFFVRTLQVAIKCIKCHEHKYPNYLIIIKPNLSTNLNDLPSH